jgi:hypothetical protein
MAGFFFRINKRTIEQIETDIAIKIIIERIFSSYLIDRFCLMRIRNEIIYVCTYIDISVSGTLNRICT